MQLPASKVGVDRPNTTTQTVGGENGRYEKGEVALSQVSTRDSHGGTDVDCETDIRHTQAAAAATGDRDTAGLSEPEETSSDGKDATETCAPQATSEVVVGRSSPPAGHFRANDETDKIDAGSADSTTMDGGHAGVS